MAQDTAAVHAHVARALVGSTRRRVPRLRSCAARKASASSVSAGSCTSLTGAEKPRKIDGTTGAGSPSKVKVCEASRSSSVREATTFYDGFDYYNSCCYSHGAER